MPHEWERVRGGKSAHEWKQSARHAGHSPGRSHDDVFFLRLGIFTMRSQPVLTGMKGILHKSVLLQFQFHSCSSVCMLLCGHVEERLMITIMAAVIKRKN